MFTSEDLSSVRNNAKELSGWPRTSPTLPSKGNNRITRKKCDICSELTGSFIVNSEHISHLFLVFLLLTLNK